MRVISGDNPVTVSEVARQAGIPDADLYVDASELQTDEEIAEAAEHYAVFGRVTPDQKRKLVQADISCAGPSSSFRLVSSHSSAITVSQPSAPIL